MNFLQSLSFGWSWPITWTGYIKPMLEIELKRLTDNQWCTIGALSMPGFVCSTIELPKASYNGSNVRIPAGRYSIRLFDSPKHGPNTPLLVGVPGRSLIEIHASNYAIRPSDGLELLLGCIALGTNPTTISVDNSGDTCKQFMSHIDPKLWTEGEVWITITDN